MKVLVILGFMLLLPIMFGASADACQYVESDNTIQENFEEYDFIFSAKILTVGEYASYTPVTLKVIEQWKGDTHDTAYLFTCKGKDFGGLQLQEDKSYLIFAEKLSSDSPIVTDFSPTKLLSEAQDDILFLDQKSHVTRFHYDESNVVKQTPLQQFNSGIQFDEIQCKEDLVLIQKYDGTPACVMESTKTKLIERGWTGNIMVVNNEQSWGYIKDISILNNGYVGFTMSYPTNTAYHEQYPSEYNSIIGNCDSQNDSANLSILYLKGIDLDANTITFSRENKIFDNMSCNDAFWKEMTQYGYCPPTHLMSQTETLTSSITDAQKGVDFSLHVPKYLPEGYDVQKIRVDSDRKRAMLFISPMPVTNETDMCKFTWDDEGIYLSYVSIPDGAPRFASDPDKERITINGNRGYVEHRSIGDRAGTPIPQRSELLWHMPEDNLVLNMYSSLSSEELIKIAESLE